MLEGCWHRAHAILWHESNVLALALMLGRGFCLLYQLPKVYCYFARLGARWLGLAMVAGDPIVPLLRSFRYNLKSHSIKT
jgi:hypothetical protein